MEIRRRIDRCRRETLMWLNNVNRKPAPHLHCTFQGKKIQQQQQVDFNTFSSAESVEKQLWRAQLDGNYRPCRIYLSELSSMEMRACFSVKCCRFGVDWLDWCRGTLLICACVRGWGIESSSAPSRRLLHDLAGKKGKGKTTRVLSPLSLSAELFYQITRSTSQTQGFHSATHSRASFK